MKIDFTATINDLDGKLVTERTPEGTLVIKDGAEVPVTLGSMAIQALLSTMHDGRGQPEQLDGVTKVKHALLAQSIHTSPADVDLKVEEIATIKDRIARIYQPLAVMRAWAVLDG